MAKAIPAMSGEVKEEENKKVEEKSVVTLPKPKEKVTLPDGTVIENF
jgi:hypothetical protein